MTLVPALSSRTLGAYRIALGCAMIWAFYGLVIPATPREFYRHLAGPDLEIIHAIADSATAIRWVHGVAIAAALLFTLGLFTRVAYAVMLACVTALALAMLEYGSVHHLGVPLISMLGWLTIRWGDSLSLDRLRTHAPPPDAAPSAVNGFAIWWPGLVVGLALATAGCAKLARSGWGWVSSGAVRYHFVTDGPNAPVTWGLWIAIHPWVAVVASGAALLLELTFILFAIQPKVWMRFVAFALGGALFSGLFLFQGVYWPTWMMLFLAFLPWTWLDRDRPAVRTGGLSMVQRAAVVAILAVQGYAVWNQFQVEPFVSNFPMYSGTFDSPDDYDARMGWRFMRFDTARGDNRDILSLVQTLPEDQQVDLTRLAEHQAGVPTVTPVPGPMRITNLCNVYRSRAAIPQEVTLAVSRRGFDWTTGAFRTAYVTIPTGPVQLAALCESNGSP